MQIQLSLLKNLIQFALSLSCFLIIILLYILLITKLSFIKLHKLVLQFEIVNLSQVFKFNSINK